MNLAWFSHEEYENNSVSPFIISCFFFKPFLSHYLNYRIFYLTAVLVKFCYPYSVFCYSRCVQIPLEKKNRIRFFRYLFLSLKVSCLVIAPYFATSNPTAFRYSLVRHEFSVLQNKYFSRVVQFSTSQRTLLFFLTPFNCISTSQ